MRSQDWEAHVVGGFPGDTHMDRSQEPFCIEIYRKSAAPGFHDKHFDWKFTGKNAHGHVRGAILCGNLQEKCRTLFSGTAFCVEIYRENAHGDFARGTFCCNLQGNMPDTDPTTSIKHRALTLTVRTPQCGHTVLGIRRNGSSGYAKHCDLILLALSGFIAIGYGNRAKARYAEDDPNFLLAANRLQLFSPELSFEELQTAVPVSAGPAPNLDQNSATDVCEALAKSKLLKGFPIAIDKLPDYDLTVHADILPSQLAHEPPESSTRPPEQQSLTQVALGNPEASDDEQPAKRLRHQPLQVADLRSHKDAVTKTWPGS